MSRKFFVITSICLTLLILLFSCKKKEPATENNPPDKPPVPLFNTGENLIGDNITFKVLASDPDGDSISARFDWGDGDTSSWCDFVPTEDTITMRHSFHTKGTFYIKAQVKDIHEATSFWSDADSIVIKDSVRTLVWTCATPHAPWSPRGGQTSVVFDNKIWVIGGGTNDVWSSADGVNWTCATESTAWRRRGGHTSVVLDNKIWILGGWASTDPLNDVWFSSDGVNWMCATESAMWTFRQNHTSVAFDNKIWVIGGCYRGNVNVFNDAWFSSDGANWTCATESAGWSKRNCHKSTVFDGKIWVCGGENFHNRTLPHNDVWNSANGADWICVTDSADWPGRYGHEFVVFDNRIWILGGCAKDGSGHSPSNDVWFSNNGSDWTCMTDSAPWSRREYFSSVVFDNKIWVIGGYPELNDVWYGEIVLGKR